MQTQESLFHFVKKALIQVYAQEQELDRGQQDNIIVYLASRHQKLYFN